MNRLPLTTPGIQTLLAVRPHFSFPHCVQKLRTSDLKWLCKVVDRIETARINSSTIDRPGMSASGDNDLENNPAHTNADAGHTPIIVNSPFTSTTIDLFCRPIYANKVYGETSFSRWNSQWEQLEIAVWMQRIIVALYPTVILTAYAHFIDEDCSVPGIRVGSDLRIYQQFMPVTHRLAVLDVLATAANWTYLLIFVYGDENGDEPAVSEKMGVLRVPGLMVGPVNEEYDDNLCLDVEDLDWSDIHMENRYNVAIAFPISHHRRAVDVLVYDVPLDMVPTHRVYRYGTQTGIWPIDDEP